MRSAKPFVVQPKTSRVKKQITMRSAKPFDSAAQNIALKAGTFTGKEANYHEICSIWKNRSIVQPKTSRVKKQITIRSAKPFDSAAQNIALKAGTFTGKEANYHEICSIWKKPFEHLIDRAARNVAFF